MKYNGIDSTDSNDYSSSIKFNNVIVYRVSGLNQLCYTSMNGEALTDSIREEEGYHLKGFNEMEISVEEEHDYDPWRTSILSEDNSYIEDKVASTRSSIHNSYEEPAMEVIEEEKNGGKEIEAIEDHARNKQRKKAKRASFFSANGLNKQVFKIIHTEETVVGD